MLLGFKTELKINVQQRTSSYSSISQVLLVMPGIGGLTYLTDSSHKLQIYEPRRKNYFLDILGGIPSLKKKTVLELTCINWFGCIGKTGELLWYFEVSKCALQYALQPANSMG